MATLLLLFIVMCLLLVPLYVIYKPPGFVIRYLQHRWPSVLWKVETSSKVVALTIDDGPSEYTHEIMEVLKANDATATFFIIGAQVPGKESILRDLVRNGNELGNHAMHDEPSRSLSDTVLTAEIETVRGKVDEAYTDVGLRGPPLYFRPGSGLFSEPMLKILGKLNYKLVLGSIYPHDAQISYWSVNARHILSMLRPGGIIICHDRRSWTLPMLQKVLPEIKRRGYRIVTVTKLLEESSSRQT